VHFITANNCAAVKLNRRTADILNLKLPVDVAEMSAEHAANAASRKKVG
jgi:hypothetical protein